MTRARLIVAVAALVWEVPSRADTPTGLTVSWAVDGSITGGAFAVWGISALTKGALVPPACRWCSAGGLDVSVRDAVVWSNKRAAGAASDALQFGVPVGMVAYDLVAARASEMHAFADDALVIIEPVAMSIALTQVAKYSTARIRPNAYFTNSDSTRDDHISFWSGHAVAAFSAAAAGGTVARLRGYQGWPWVYAAGFTGAALTAYFRMASDEHWLTDVLASAAAGTAVGIAVPLLHRADPATTYQVIPTLGGLAVVGEF